MRGNRETSARDGASSEQDEPLLIRDEQCAHLAGISRATWWKLDSTGQVPACVKLGRSTRWRRQEIGAWIKAGCPSREVWEQMNGERN